MRAKNVDVSNGTQTRVFGNGVTQTITNLWTSRDALNVPIQSTDKMSHPLTPKALKYQVQRLKGMKGTWGIDKRYYPPSQWIDCTGYTGAMPALIGEDLLPSKSYIRNRALEKLGEKTRGSLDMSINAFEIKQTASMLKLFTPNGIIRHADEIARALGSPKNWRKYLTIPADFWLQWQYGMRPIMQDIYDASDLSLRQAKNTLESFEASYVEQLDGTSTQRQATPVDFSADPNWKAQDRRTGLRDVVGVRLSKFGITYNVDALNELALWSSLNPASIAWEVIPGSFVFDWFVDVGGFLRSVENACLSDVAFGQGYETSLTAYDAEAFVDGRFRDNIPHIWNVKISGSIHYVDLERKVLSTYPLPSLPSFRAELGAERLLSAAALLAQFLPGSSPNAPALGKTWEARVNSVHTVRNQPGLSRKHSRSEYVANRNLGRK
jgi:hypothetical protein